VTVWQTVPAPAWVPWCILALVAMQRVLELVKAKRNTARLLARGAREVAAGHYPLIVALHAAWLVALMAWVLLHPATINGGCLALYVAVQALRLWTLASLGPYWTTRIITLPGAPLVRRGPYRFVRHPNYLVVALEIAILPLALGAWPVAAAFSILNALLLRVRLKAENEALAERARRPTRAPGPA
jgi:methyltransferase